MKKLILIELLNRIRSRPDLKKKLKIFVAVAAAGFFIFTAILIWAGVAAYRFVNEQLQTSLLSAPTKKIETQIKNLPTASLLNCWNGAQGLLAVEPWLTRPFEENLNKIKIACLKGKAEACTGEKCEDVNENKNENWETI